MKIMSYFAHTVSVLVLLLLTAACTEKDDKGFLPQINTFTPVQGTTGTQVTIRGKFLPADKKDASVFFNAKQGTITNSSSESMTVEVPTGASTGKIKIVYKGSEIQSTDDFLITVGGAPLVTSFAPLQGKIGDEITINGANFLAAAALNVVSFNGAAAEVIAASPTQLTVRVPEGTSTGKITVSVLGLSTASVQSFIYLPPPPEITSVYINDADVSNTIPNTTSRVGHEGSTIVIKGQNFDTNRLGNVVKINDMLIPLVASASRLFVTLRSDQQQVINDYRSDKTLLGILPKGVTTGTLTVRANGITVAYPEEITIIQKNTWKKLTDLNLVIIPKIVEGNIIDAFNNLNNFIIGTKAYFFGNTPQVLEYDLPTDTWTDKSADARSRFATSLVPGVPNGSPPSYGNKTATFVIAGKAYVLATSANNDINELSTYIFEYDPTDVTNPIAPGGTWVRLAEVPYTNSARKIREQSVGFAISGKGYFGGGIATGGTIEGASNDFYEFTPPDGANPLGLIRRVANFGTNVPSGGAASPLNALSFVKGGVAYVFSKSGFYKYIPNASNGTWTLLPPISSGSTGVESAGFMIGDNIYIGTGRGSNQVRYKQMNTAGLEANAIIRYEQTNKMARFNTNSETWSASALRAFANGESVIGTATGFSIANRGFLGAGNIEYFDGISFSFVNQPVILEYIPE
jgi:hypothetical protein